MASPARDQDDSPTFTAEWPASLAVAEAWTADTILAADPGHTPTTLMALTPTPNGDLRVDPVPMQDNNSGSGFGYGYTGGTPAMTCLAVMRCAVGAEAFEQFTQSDGALNLWRRQDILGETGQPSLLWQAISTTQGPLRLAWSHVQQWAEDDLERALGHSTRRRRTSQRT